MARPRKGNGKVSLPEHVQAVKRGKKVHYYYAPHRGTDKAGKRVALGSDPFDPEFNKRLREAQEASGRAKKDFSNLIANYKASSEYERLAKGTKRDYNSYLERIDHVWGDVPVIQLTRAAIYAIRDEMSSTPVAANHMLSILRTLIEWGVPRGYRDDNPAIKIKRLEVEDDGAKPWPEWAYEYAIKHAPEDLRRAIFLARETGQRRSDVVKMSPAHRKENGITVRIQKLKNKEHWVPLTQSVIKQIDSWGVKDLDLYVKSTVGKPYSGDHLHSRWNRWKASEIAAPLKGQDLTLHGLRAMAVIDKRKDGLTHQQISAQIGMSLKMVMHYSRFADQVELAKSGMVAIEEKRNRV